jgi:predicted negative regulator of RcsB-dependent stress response
MAEELLTDDEQWEAIKRWTTENGIWVVAGVALGAALLFGYRFYEGHRTSQAQNAAAQFDVMTAALDSNDRAAAKRSGEALIKGYPSTPYADQAELLLARLAMDEGHEVDAVAALTHVMNDSKDEELRNVARLRLARVRIDQGKPDEAVQTLAVAAPGKFAARFHDVRGDALFAKNDLAGAAVEYQAALDGGDPRGADTALIELKLADLGKGVVTPANKAAR